MGRSAAPDRRQGHPCHRRRSQRQRGALTLPPVPRLDELDLVLVTQRLRLRPFCDDDVDDLWPYVSTQAVPKAMGWKPHASPDETLDHIRAAGDAFTKATAVTWAIEHDGRAVGSIDLHELAYDLRAWRVDRAELGYWLAPPLWRQGLMTEAAQAVVQAGFERIGLHKISVGCLVENTGSRRVIEKLNFRPIGRLEDDVWFDNRWWSVLRYELTAPEWSDVTTTMRVRRPVPA